MTEHIFVSTYVAISTDKVRRVIFNAWPPFVKFLTVPIEMNFNHVPHFFILCCLYWINVSIRSLFFCNS